MEMDVYSDLNQAVFVTAFWTKKVASELVANTDAGSYLAVCITRIGAEWHWDRGPASCKWRGVGASWLVIRSVSEFACQVASQLHKWQRARHRQKCSILELTGWQLANLQIDRYSFKVKSHSNLSIPILCFWSSIHLQTLSATSYLVLDSCVYEMIKKKMRVQVDALSALSNTQEKTDTGEDSGKKMWFCCRCASLLRAGLKKKWKLQLMLYTLGHASEDFSEALGQSLCTGGI